MHSFVVTQNQIAALWSQIRRGPDASNEKGRQRIFADIVKNGHAATYQIDDILYHSGFGMSAGRDIYEGLSYPSRVLYLRPGVRVTAAIGRSYNTATEVAALLKRLERLGLAVDPEPLVDALLPSLKGKSFLTHDELEVWWFHRARHRMETVMVETDRGAGPGKYHKFKTSTGYRVEASERGGRVEWITATAPKYRFRSKLMAA